MNNNLEASKRIYLTKEFIFRIRSKNNLSFKSNQSSKNIQNYINKAKLLGGKVSEYLISDIITASTKLNEKVNSEVFASNSMEGVSKIYVVELKNQTIVLASRQIYLPTHTYGMFTLSKNSSIDFTNVDTHEVETFSLTFSNSSIKLLDFTNANLKTLTNLDQAFKNSRIQEIRGLNNLGLSYKTSLWETFKRFETNELNLDGFIQQGEDNGNINQLTLLNTFSNCKINKLNLGTLDFSNIKPDLIDQTFYQSEINTLILTEKTFKTFKDADCFRKSKIKNIEFIS